MVLNYRTFKNNFKTYIIVKSHLLGGFFRKRLYMIKYRFVFLGINLNLVSSKILKLILTQKLL